MQQGKKNLEDGQSVSATSILPLKRGQCARDSNDRQVNEAESLLASTAQKIASTLLSWEANDSIRQCGTAVLNLLHQQPDKTLSFAREKLYTWPYKDVPECWRRLYEDASLLKAGRLIQKMAGTSKEDNMSRKRSRYANSKDHNESCENDSLSAVVEVLDMGITLSGQPARKQLYQQVFDSLMSLVKVQKISNLATFNINTPPPLRTSRGVTFSERPSFEAFNDHIQKSRTPLVIEKALEEWPALQRWSRPSYLLDESLGGRRLVPVEIGNSYTDTDWTQKLMPFGQYLEEYVLQSKADVGYLAQHDLLSQIPALCKDIRIPDYCFTSPPRPSDNRIAELETPIINAWFGPAGTRSPLHTDPYHNLLCQVLGYKYVRLYSPTETCKLYPRDVDEAGISMENTSKVEFSFADREIDSGHQNWPLFSSAVYQETILCPGQCLYIPEGWWHFIESLSTSFSVSFWWN